MLSPYAISCKIVNPNKALNESNWSTTQTVYVIGKIKDQPAKNFDKQQVRYLMLVNRPVKCI